MRSAVLRAVAVVVLGLIALAGCDCGGPGPLQCTANEQCDPQGEGFLVCDVAGGFCTCVDDRGCDPGEVCNTLGRCQAESGCNSNAECREGLFCDVVANQCLSVNECQPGDGELCCVLDSQCPFDSFCDSLGKKCTPGCRDEADCILGKACVRGLGQPIGQCAAGVCSGDNLCAFGEVCNSDGECERDTRGPYCLGCTGGVASDDCGEPGNFCLTDTVNGGEFCGVDSSGGEACPFGYSPNDVIIVTNEFCTAEVCEIPDGETRGTCSRNGGPCTLDEDCPIGFPGGDCARADLGNCRIEQGRACSDDSECGDGDECVFQECRFGEGDAFGYCTCTKKSDCALGDRCVDINPVNDLGNCELSGHDCFTDEDCDAIIQCIDGGCFIGQNCAPQDGRTCRDLLVDPNPPVSGG